MTNEEAAKLLEIEMECVKRADKCDRNCSDCDLLQTSDDLLEAYRIVISALENLPQWISVKDRLPIDNKKYLVVIDGDKINEPYVSARFFWNGNFEADQYFPSRHVTHWMPLPEPPKECKEETS